jgi:DNA-binding XRE family transcriptional regulator
MRQERGLTQDALAVRVGASRTAIARLEAGFSVSPELVTRVTDALGIRRSTAAVGGGKAHGSKLPAKSLFVCYRREDAADAAGRLYDRLVTVYGAEHVFMDIASVPLGIDFVDHVREQIAKCSAVIVMIGKQWLTMKDKKRRRRLDSEDDLVRAEIRAALQQKIPVIPVVVQNAAMPVADDLPDDIRLLARRNGVALRHDQWTDGVGRLLKELDRVMG